MVADNDFARITYTEAVTIVQKVPGPKPKPNPNPNTNPDPNPKPKPNPSPDPNPNPNPTQVPGPKPGVAWEFPPKWGEELQTEHEKCAAAPPHLPDPRLDPDPDPDPDPDSVTLALSLSRARDLTLAPLWPTPNSWRQLSPSAPPPPSAGTWRRA